MFDEIHNSSMYSCYNNIDLVITLGILKPGGFYGSILLNYAKNKCFK